MEIACSWPIKDEINLRLLNLKSNIKDNMCFKKKKFLENERKPSKTPHTFFLMLDVSNDNSKTTTESSSNKSFKLNEIPNSFFKFQAHSDCCIQNIKK
jgi:hypothetical protein